MKKSSLPRIVVWLGVVSLLTDVGTEMIYPLLPLFLSDVLHAPRTFIGAVEGAAEATASLLKLVSGRMADRMNRRKPLTVFGYGVSSLIRPLIGLAQVPWQVLAARVGDRVGKGLRSSPRDALIADGTAPHERGRAYGFHQAMDNAGAIVGPMLATALLGAGVALRNVFFLAAIPGALAMAALVFGVREPMRADPQKGIRPPGAPLPSPSPSQDVSHARISHANKTLIAYLVAVALFGLGNSSDAFLLLRAQQCGVPVALVPLLWVVHNASKAALSTWAGALSDRLGRRSIIIGGWFVYALVYLGFGYSSRAWHAWALFLAYGVYYAFTEGTGKALVADLAPADARGRAFGWYNGIVGIVALPASLGFGALADRLGAHVAFTASASLAMAASLWLALLVPPPPAPPPPPAR